MKYNKEKIVKDEGGIKRNYSPLVSVLVPSYNHSKYISKCIQSILEQTYDNIELFVIDDGSTDSSQKTINAMSSKYNFIYEHQENIGLPATLNKMIMMATGKYIALLASDDVYAPNKISDLVAYFENAPQSAAVVFGNAAFINSENELVELTKKSTQYNDVVSYYISERFELNIHQLEINYKTLLGGNYVPAVSTLIRRDALLEVGLFDGSIQLEDWSMWLKLARKYSFHYMNNIVAYYRVHKNNASSTNNVALSLDVLKILEREKPYCTKHNMIPLWRERYYSSISYYFINKLYLEFVLKVMQNNPSHYFIYISKRLKYKLWNGMRKIVFSSPKGQII